MHRAAPVRGGPAAVALSLLLVAAAAGATTVGTRGLYSKNITETEVTIPVKITFEGALISYNVTHYHDGSNDPVYFNVTAPGDTTYLLEVFPTKDFLSPNIVIERRRKNVHTRKTQVDSKCHYRGSIKGHTNSIVALSACNGLAGFIKAEEHEVWLEPVHSHNVIPEDSNVNGHKHLVFRRSLDRVNNHRKGKRKKNSKKKKNALKQNCGTREPKQRSEKRLEWQKYSDLVQIQGRKRKRSSNRRRQHRRHRKRRRHQRSVSYPRYVETMLVADSSMMDFHRDVDVETYLLTIMNMVSTLYADPTIGNFIRVLVVRIVLLEEPDPDLDVVVNADTTLKNFCKWQKGLNYADDAHPQHHDTAILVTRRDICARQNKPCSTLGVAHVGGMCQPERSCSVNEDNGISLAHTITHELGHNFGMYHDTEKTGCHSSGNNILHVMTPSFEADTVGITWSPCSRRDITNFFDQGLGSCLDDEPSPDSSTETYAYPELPAGAMYNAAHQCRLQFGRASQSCSPPDDICSRLWCEIDGMCTTILKPPAHGTHCGKHMWCQNQQCVPISHRPLAIDGGWGEWGEWSECSRSCGAGVSVRERRCDHPAPAGGGKYCVGERRRYRICSTRPCPDGALSFRAVQCAKYNNQTFRGRKYKWLPYYEQTEPCELYCTDEDETVIVPWGYSALDGTPCNVGTRDLCISGICRKVGCDWIVDSDAKEDRCGVCRGEGKLCNSVKGMYSKQAMGPGYKEVVVIPAGSRNIRIDEVDHSKNFIGIGSAKTRDFYLNGNWQISIGGEYKVAGATALYERDNEWEKVKIPGPLKGDILVYMISRAKAHNPGIEYEYTVPRLADRRQPGTEREWQLSDWSPCSATCGGGVQKREAVCVDVSTRVHVSDAGSGGAKEVPGCPEDERPVAQMRVCNVDTCPTHWWVGPWQQCRASCIKKGSFVYRLRSVMCVDGREMALPDKRCDVSSKPRDRELCRRLPICTEEK